MGEWFNPAVSKTAVALLPCVRIALFEHNILRWCLDLQTETKKTVVELIRLKSVETGALSHFIFQNNTLDICHKITCNCKNSCDNLFVYAHGTIYYINTVQKLC